MDFLPDDPTIFDPPINGVSDISNYVNPIYPNYIKRRELSEYSKWCLNKVIQICEQIYKYLKSTCLAILFMYQLQPAFKNLLK
jgi:hypothetical protein